MNRNTSLKIAYWCLFVLFGAGWFLVRPSDPAKGTLLQLFLLVVIVGVVALVISWDKKKAIPRVRARTGSPPANPSTQLQARETAERASSPQYLELAETVLPSDSSNKLPPVEGELLPQGDLNASGHSIRGMIIEVSPTRLVSPSGPALALQTAQSLVYEIAVPKDLVWNPERAVAFVEQVLTLMQGTVALQIVAEPGRIVWRLFDYQVEWQNTDGVIKGIRTIYPEAEVTVSPYRPPSVGRGFYRIVYPLVMANTVVGWVAPLRTVDDVKPAADPLAAVVQALGDNLQPGSTTSLTLCIDNYVDDQTRKRGESTITKSNVNWLGVALNLTLGGAQGWASTAAQLGGMAVSGNLKRDKYESGVQKQLAAKPYLKQLWNVSVLVQQDAIDRAQLAHTANAVNALENGYKTDHTWLDSPSSHDYSPTIVAVKTESDEDRSSAIRIALGFDELYYKKRERVRCILCAQEIAALFHLPHKEFKTAAIKWIAPGRPSEAVLNNREGVVIGKNGDNEIRISNEGGAKHTNIVGKSGTGKSTIMHATVHQNIERGLGMCVVDPHGQFIRDILERSIPDKRMDDVVLLDLANTDYPPPLNPFNLADANGQVGIGQIMAVLDKVYDLSSTTRAVDYIQLALNTIKFRDTPTIRDAVVVLRNPVERQKFLTRYGDKLDRASKEAWREFLAKETGQDSILDPVVRRLRRFYQTDYVYAMLCHPDSLNWDRLMKENKIILVSLGVDGQKVPELEQQLLGALVVSQIELTARRAGREHPLNFRLYIDEAQKFVTTSLPMMFEEIRKYGVWITIANQFLGQLNGRTLDATMGNVTNTFSFEVGKDDAKELAAYMQPTFTVEDLTSLGIRRAAVKTVMDGKSQPPFLVDTLPPPLPHPDGASRVEQIKKRSIALWTPKTQAEVMAWLDERYPEAGFGIPKGDEPNKPDLDNEDFEVAG